MDVWTKNSIRDTLAQSWITLSSDFHISNWHCWNWNRCVPDGFLLGHWTGSYCNFEEKSSQEPQILFANFQTSSSIHVRAKMSRTFSYWTKNRRNFELQKSCEWCATFWKRFHEENYSWTNGVWWIKQVLFSHKQKSCKSALVGNVPLQYKSYVQILKKHGQVWIPLPSET